MGELHEEEHRGDAVELAVGAQELERPHGIGPLPRKRRALVLRERFRQHEVAVGGVGERERPGHPERQARVDAAQHAAESWPEGEAQPEPGADHAEGGRSLLLRSDVGDVGERGRDTRRGDARDHAPDEEPGEVRGKRHEEVVQPQAEAGDEDHRPAAEAVRDRAQERHEHELHQPPRRAEDAVDRGRARRVAALEALHELGQHRDHDAHGDHVHHHEDEDEDERGGAGGHGTKVAGKREV